MNKELAREIINYCETKTYKDMLVRYYHSDIMIAVRYIGKLKSATDDDKRKQDIVYWKVAMRPLS